jgi:hypothetical protein
MGATYHILGRRRLKVGANPQLSACFYIGKMVFPVPLLIRQQKSGSLGPASHEILRYNACSISVGL